MLNQNKQYTVEELKAEFDRVNNRKLDHATQSIHWGVIFDKLLLAVDESAAVELMDRWIDAWMSQETE